MDNNCRVVLSGRFIIGLGRAKMDRFNNEVADFYLNTEAQALKITGAWGKLLLMVDATDRIMGRLANTSHPCTSMVVLNGIFVGCYDDFDIATKMITRLIGTSCDTWSYSPVNIEFKTVDI